MNAVDGELAAGVERVAYLVGCIAGMDWASDRGYLPPEDEVTLREYQAELAALDARLRARWDARAPAAVEAYDVAARAALARLRAAGGVLDNYHLADLEPRALRTLDPTRAWDAWAVRAALALTAG